jgi:hypothetical protein
MSSLAPTTTNRAWVTELRPPERLTPEKQLARRRREIGRLDPMVRRQLTQLGGMTPIRVAPPTVYDALYPATPEIGGHWDASWSVVHFFTHAIWSYAVSLAFDEHGQPLRFVVEGASTIESDGLDEAALARALEQAALSGPLRTTAPHAFTGFGL